MNGKSNCEYCSYYTYDDETEEYICTVDLDEDENERFLTYTFEGCPYFRKYDEYGTVRKQN